MSELNVDDALAFVKTHSLNDPRETVLYVRCAKCNSKVSCAVGDIDGLYNFFENHAHHKCFVKSEFNLEEIEILKEAPLPLQAPESKQPVEGTVSNGNSIITPEGKPPKRPRKRPGPNRSNLYNEDTEPLYELPGDPTSRGWVKVYRKIIDNSIFRDSYAYHLFSYLLLKANHKAKKFIFNQEEMLIKRGELLTGIRRISAHTGMSQWIARNRLKILENLGIITHQTTHRFSLITICNYDYYQGEETKEPHTKPHTEQGKEQPEGENVKITQLPHTDHTLTTTNKNDKKNKYVEGQEPLRLATLLLEEIRKNKPDFKTPDLQKWAGVFDLMLRIDKRDASTVERVIKWVQSDHGSGTGSWRGWAANILSPGKLRERFDELELKMREAGPGARPEETPLEIAKRHIREREAREYGNPN